MFYKSSSVAYWNTCEPWIEFECRNGEWKHTTVNKTEYPSEVECVEGPPNRCEIWSTNDNYTLTEILIHGSWSTLTKEDITFQNGEKILSQEFTCNNGDLVKRETPETWEITKCDMDYYAHNDLCEWVWIWYYSPDESITRTACSNKLGNSSYTTSGSGSNTCEYTCESWYEWASCSAKQKTITSGVYSGRTFSFTSFELIYGTSQTKTSSALTITWGTSTLTATFTLASNGTDVTLSAQSENIVCSSGYYKNGTNCSTQWSWNTTTWYLFTNTSGTAQYPTSCNNLLTSATWKNTFLGSPWNGTKFVDGMYFIKPDSWSAFKVYCDMTNNGWWWTRTHILRYVNLNSTFATSQNYTWHIANTADKMWNTSIDGWDNSYFRPLKRMNDYTTWVWLTDTQYVNVTLVTTSASNKSNGRKVDLQNYIDYWYNGLTMSERPDYIVNAGAISWGTSYTITKWSCTLSQPYHVKWWRNGANHWWEVLVSHNNWGTCVWMQPPSIPFQFSAPGSWFPGMSISWIAVDSANADQTRWHSLWVK